MNLKKINETYIQYIYTYTHTYVYVYTHTHVHVFESIFTSKYIHVNIYIYIYIMYICVCCCLSTLVCIYMRTVCMYACMHACMYVCVYACMYVCIYAGMCVCVVCICACACVCVCVCTWLATHVKEPWSSLKGIKERDLFIYIYMFFPPFLGSGKWKEKPPFHVPPTSERHDTFRRACSRVLTMRSCIECRVQKQTFTWFKMRTEIPGNQNGFGTRFRKKMNQPLNHSGRNHSPWVAE